MDENDNAGNVASTSTFDKFNDNIVIDITNDDPIFEQDSTIYEDCQTSFQYQQNEEFRPQDVDDFKPKIGSTFNSFEDVHNMYKLYAKSAGFGIRLGSVTRYKDKSLRKRHIRCNRYGEGKSRSKSIDAEDVNYKRKRLSYTQSCGCNAMIGVNRDFHTNMFSIYTFEESHNHPLNISGENVMSKDRRKMQYVDYEFIAKHSTIRIGPTRAHNLKATSSGGPFNVGSSKVDYKNFWRDYVSIVGPNDAQCVVNQFSFRNHTNPNFFFKYKLKENQLHSMIWVDEEAKFNYSRFSDVISFDGTYRTNRYNMIFVPFTAINHHMKNINIGAALLGDEKTETYTWMLECFLEAHSKEPSLVMTDQDPAMIQSITKVFKNSKHRLCMWHIMSKLTLKIPHHVLSKTEFRKRINKIVWNINLDQEEFEAKWDMMLDEFDLKSNKWLHDMYMIRERWIPAYFRQVPLCGLMKTTSRSESSNSFFNIFASPTNLLVNSMINFETAIEKQRFDEKQMDDVSNNTTPNTFITSQPLLIEIHASNVYTRSVFAYVQKELKKAYNFCFQKNMQMDGKQQVCAIVFKNYKLGTKEEYKVLFNEDEMSIQCSCNMFHYFGILCCHAFRVFLNNDVESIPDFYVLPRWRKQRNIKSIKNFGNQWGVGTTETSMLVQEANRLMEECINKVANNKEKLHGLVEKLRILNLECDTLITKDEEPKNMEHIIENVFGFSIPSEIEIHPPSVLRNKGGTKRTRMISSIEKAKAIVLRRKRICKGCNKYVHHDIRNCPVNPKVCRKPLKTKKLCDEE